MKKVVLFDIDYTLFDTGAFKDSKRQTYKLYDEVEKVIKQVKNIADVGIFSEGQKDFQHDKLLKTNIKQYIVDDRLHIVAKKDDALKNILSKYKNVKLFLVDDKLSVLDAAKDYMSQIFTIWIKRGMYAESQEDIHGFSPDATVYNLEEIISYVKDN